MKFGRMEAWCLVKIENIIHVDRQRFAYLTSPEYSNQIQKHQVASVNQGLKTSLVTVLMSAWEDGLHIH